VEQATLSLRATAHDLVTETLTDTGGAFAISLPPGAYTMTVSHPAHPTAVLPRTCVTRDVTTAVTITLSTTTLQGQITRDNPAEPVTTARVRLADTTFSTTVDAKGCYTIAVSPGTYTVEVLPGQAGLRGDRQSVTISERTETYTHSVTLDEAPRVLVVHADAWAGDDQAFYYRDGLDAALWGFDERHIATKPSDIPALAELLAYDAVVWSHPSLAPSTLDVWDALEAYVNAGGRLLMSGQNVAAMDDTGPAGPISGLFHATRGTHVDAQIISGTEPGPLSGLTATVNHPDSAGNQTSITSLSPTDGWARPLAINEDHTYLAVGSRLPHAATALLSFGLEGIGPTEARANYIASLLDWLLAPTAQHRLRLILIARAAQPF